MLFTKGCVHTEEDCLMLIAMAKANMLPVVKKRNLVSIASIGRYRIYIYNEEEALIKRWTDKKQWSPSRVSGCFLTYREMNGSLCKKTFSKVTDYGKYHIVIYTLFNEELLRECCVQTDNYVQSLRELTLNDPNILAYLSSNIDEPKYRQQRRKKQHRTTTYRDMLSQLSTEGQLTQFCFPDQNITESAQLRRIFNFDEPYLQLRVRNEIEEVEDPEQQAQNFDHINTELMLFERSIPLNDAVVNFKKNSSTR